MNIIEGEGDEGKVAVAADASAVAVAASAGIFADGGVKVTIWDGV